MIRKMTESDTEKVAEIAACVFATPWSREGFEEALMGDNACFLVAAKGEEVLGYCGLYMAADEGEILNIAVQPKSQRQGIADQLMRALLSCGKEYGVSRFFLEVRVGNEAAIRLYEKHGFARKGIRRDFYKDNHEDAYVMNRIEERS